MSKLKQLLPSDKDVVHIDIPVQEDELLDRHLQYPLLQPYKFAKRMHDKKVMNYLNNPSGLPKKEVHFCQRKHH